MIEKVLVSLLYAVAVSGLPQAITPGTTETVNNETDLSTSFAILSCAPAASFEMKRLTRLLPKVLANAKSSSKKSWEIGSVTQAVLEVYDPHFTPFEWDASAVKDRQIPWDVLDITKAAMVEYDWSGSPDETTTKNASRTLAESDEVWLGEYLTETPPVPVKNIALVRGDGAQGDPCSVGPAVWLMAQLADREEVKERGGFKKPEEYAWAVGNQKKNLTIGPQDGNGSRLSLTIHSVTLLTFSRLPATGRLYCMGRHGIHDPTFYRS
jgi:hypothetical protein